MKCKKVIFRLCWFFLNEVVLEGIYIGNIVIKIGLIYLVVVVNLGSWFKWVNISDVGK